MPMTYLGDCAALDGDSINEMKEGARELSRRAFLRLVDRAELRRVEASLGYEAHPRRGLTMAGDFHVSYHRGTFRGGACAYFRWSGFEHVFVER